ncbi:hypothetical protein DH2020_039486 [Rehmannia glutinosa]|uniref:Protein BIG GRAIN 1-like A n=1 Tax=Rehmannia glutinosa TaxID=99300 RepID=A0ABR0UWF1_REHGL
MAVWERQQIQNKAPSFSSSLLDAIYRSIDENEQQQHKDFDHHRKKNAAQDIESLRRAIMIEKWIENHSTTKSTSTPTHFPSNSASSTDSSIFSSSTETESSSSTKSKPLKIQQILETKPKKRDGKFATTTKLTAQKIYRDLKKVKEPISPGGKISNFLNSIFSPRNLKTNEEWSSVRKSRSVNETKTSSLSPKSCLTKNQSSRGGNRNKRSVRFCPVSVIVDEDCQPCGHKSIYSDEYSIGSRYIQKNIDSLRVNEGKINLRKHELRDCYYKNEHDFFDDMSCASSDLFELENIIGRVDVGAYEEELPVYGTTSLRKNQAM